METWRRVFRDGFAPHLSTAGLLALRAALERDDARLVQGVTVDPPPIQAVHDWPARAACGVAFCGWQGDGLIAVGDVEAYFAKQCFEADVAVQEPAGCRWFLNWFDETPREVMRRELLAEVLLILAGREDEGHAAG